MKTAAITIDVDSLRHYRAIHGLPERPDEEDPIYTIALPRFWSLLEELNLPATLFLIGADAPRYASAFTPVGSTGSEIASHSFSHDYRISTRPRAEILEDLKQADTVLKELNQGQPIQGFRAPGYNINPKLLNCVEELGYLYDSSVLPSPMYFGARWSIIQLYSLFGRTSQSLPGDWRQFTQGLSPYRFFPEQPYRKAPHGSLTQLPISCLPGLRIPLIGTSLALLPGLTRTMAIRWCVERLDFFNYEMHAIDLLDRTDHPSLAELAPHQKDLNIPSKQKMSNHRDLFSTLKANYSVRTLTQTIAPTV